MVREVPCTYQISFQWSKYGALNQINNFGAGKSLPSYWQITFDVMGWLTKILKGSSYKGQHHGKYREERNWDEARNSVVIMDSAFYGYLNGSCTSIIFLSEPIL